jgi:rhomboid family GlyGly-CTERM serine protease
MGLGQVSGATASAVRKSLIPGSIVVLSVLMAIGGSPARSALRFDRAGIQNHEIWRLVTGHLVHLGWIHFLMNIVGLTLVWLLFGGYFSSRQWIAILVVAIAGIDIGLWFLDPGLEWYVGLSGALHGMLAAGIVAGAMRGSLEAAILGFLLLAKLVWEQWLGPMPGSAGIAGGDVVVNAHLYGGVAGGLAALMVDRVGLRRTG